ncbi:peptidase family M13 [Ancylostoma duodenale]|uniref:Peptidase family M13 n=1 Tax=Ancylostoma duodenale TaxID=51022 RepID=A0A0C2H089_9BILA|nr:peptidase family M13 [Ancylostoma duodenale]
MEYSGVFVGVHSVAVPFIEGFAKPVDNRGNMELLSLLMRNGRVIPVIHHLHLHQLQTAYHTFKKNLGAEGRFEAVQDISNDQMFFLAYATSFCNKHVNEDWYLMYVATDKHAPDVMRSQASVISKIMQYLEPSAENRVWNLLSPARVNKVLANLPEFAEAFHCAPGTTMNPESRCSLY